MGESLTREEAVKRFAPLVERMARKYHRPRTGLTLEDLRQTAYLGVLRGYDSYDPSRGVSLVIYMTLCIRTAVVDEIRKYTKYRNKRKLYAHQLTDLSAREIGSAGKEVWSDLERIDERERLLRASGSLVTVVRRLLASERSIYGTLEGEGWSKGKVGRFWKNLKMKLVRWGYDKVS